eukprot:TCONS_00039715-protein
METKKCTIFSFVYYYLTLHDCVMIVSQANFKPKPFLILLLILFLKSKFQRELQNDATLSSDNTTTLSSDNATTKDKVSDETPVCNFYKKGNVNMASQAKIADSSIQKSVPSY